jgi:2-dehydro-3-deoxyphosphogluconate aldolase / (4S)-4-hydroxy-2-oxoglutarate aldolase
MTRCIARERHHVDKQRVRDRIAEVGVVPVVRASSSREAVLAAEAVCEGGIPIVEITMTVPGALEVIRELERSSPSGVLIGAGTVLDVAMARRCRDAGAQFLVSPGLHVPLVEFAVQEGIFVIAGALTPTEIISNWKAGSEFVKIFPLRPGLSGPPQGIRSRSGDDPEENLITLCSACHASFIGADTHQREF